MATKPGGRVRFEKAVIPKRIALTNIGHRRYEAHGTMELAGHEFQGMPHHIIADYGDFGRIWIGAQRRQIGGNGLEGQARNMTYRGFSI